MAVDLPPRKRKRPIAEMNVVPYIDVMLVLLIIFMVTAPMLSTGEIEIPSAGASAKPPEQFIRVSINATNEISISSEAGATITVSLEQLVHEIKSMQTQQSENIPVIIAADKLLPYENVVRILNTLHENNIQRVGLLTTK